MLQLPVPANVMMLFSAVIPIVGWDMLEGAIDWETQTIFKYTKAETPFPGQLEDLGYDGSNWVINMQTIALLMFAITLKLIIYCILKLANCCCSCARGHYTTMFIKWLESTLFF